MKIWFLIPARAGSKGIPKKNIKVLGKKPLINHILDTINEFIHKDSIIVSTDDEDVMSLVQNKCILHKRSVAAASDKATLDEVAIEVANYLLQNGAKKNDVLITCQPTSPFLTKATIQKAIDAHTNKDIHTVITVKDDRHLRWSVDNDKIKPNYERRVNRQALPLTYSETGGLISSTLGQITNHKTRIGKKISILITDDKEGLDIDTYADWALAEYWINRKSICIRVDGSNNLGFGHLYRALAVAQNIHSHHVNFVTRYENEFEMGYKFLQKYNYPITKVSSNQDFLEIIGILNPDIVINDILDTSIDYIQQLKNRGCFVVNFEDLGEGNTIADIVINDLYPDLNPRKNHWYGVQNAILNPNFESVSPRIELGQEVKHILIACGGSDPSNLTGKSIEALQKIGFQNDITVVLGPGNLNYSRLRKKISNSTSSINLLHNVDNMAELMVKADMAITSAGRTVTELMSAGVPTIAMCQNIREMTHNHASSSYGIINLGMGKEVSADVLARHIELLIKETSFRKEMWNRMSNAVRGRLNHKIINKILNIYKDQSL